MVLKNEKQKFNRSKGNRKWDSGYVLPIVQDNALLRLGHNALAGTVSLALYNVPWQGTSQPSPLSTDRLPRKCFYERVLPAPKPGATDRMWLFTVRASLVDLSATWRSKHVISCNQRSHCFAYNKRRRAITGEIVVLTCQTRMLI